MTLQSLGLSGRAMSYWLRRQESTAHNLANLETPGFRAERIFARMGAGGEPVPFSATSHRAGALSQSGNPLDVALAPAAFMVVETAAGERLMRGGALQLDEGGRLLDAAGNAVLGEQGAIVLPTGPVHIDAEGTIRVGEQVVDRLRIETVPENARMDREGTGLFVPPAGRVAVDAGGRGVRQGWIEGSNVNALESMVEMLSVQRSFGAVQNSVRVLDGVLDRIANDIGRVG